MLDTADGSDSDSSDSDSDIPLATLKKKKLSQKSGTLFHTIYCCNGYPHVKTVSIISFQVSGCFLSKVGCLKMRCKIIVESVITLC